MANTVTTLRPNGTFNAAGWAATGGAGSLHAATSDNSDSTGASAAAATALDSLVLDLTTFTFPALAQLRTITLRVRASQATGSQHIRWYLIRQWTDGSPVAATSPPYDAVPTSSAATFTSAPITSASWFDQAQLDYLKFAAAVTASGSATSPPQADDMVVQEAYVDVAYNQAPVATVTAPTGAPSTTRPPVTWTYSDPENDAQERSRVKIFSAAQYGAPDFDPETSAATWDSGVVLSAAHSKTPTVDLTNGTTYKAYVKVADVGSSGRFGPWDDGSAFTITLSPPSTPTLDATAGITNPRVQLVTTNNHAATGSITIERSVDAGVSWTTVRGTTYNTLAGATSSPRYDYEAPTDITIQYRAALTVVVSGDTLVSDYGTDTATLAQTSSWLKDPLDATRNMAIDLQLPLQYKRRNKVAVVDTLGARLPISRSDGTKGEQGDANVTTVGQTEHDNLDVLLGSGRTLLLQIPAGERQRYVAVTSDAETTVQTLATSTDSYRETSFSWVEVAAP